MSPPEVWGPPIWNFLHTLVEKIHDDRFDDLGKGLIFQILSKPLLIAEDQKNE